MARKKGMVGHVEAERTVASATGRSRNRSKDTFLGETVLVLVFLFLSSFVGFLVYLGYRVVKTRDDGRISIETLSERSEPEVGQEPVTSDGETAETDIPEPDAEPETSAGPDASAVEVVVLNGGAPGGTAGKVTKALVDAGFSKAEAGNADGTHVGVVIYHDGDSEAAAVLVKEALSGTYADAKIAPADPKKKDTVAASVTVILAR